MVYNILTCSGFPHSAISFIGSGGCIKARLGIVLLFFIIALVRKWGGEEIGMSFNALFSWIGGIGIYFVLILLFGSFKIAFIVGLLAALVIGYGIGILIGDSGGGDYE